jgi:hypothetical protein
VDTSPEEEAARKKKTLLLLVGGAFSLILPLAGVLYLRWKENKAVPKQTDAAVFQQREGAERRITVAAAPAMSAAALAQPASLPPHTAGSGGLPMPPVEGKSAGGGSLGFIKPTGDYYAEKKEEPKPEPKKEEPSAAPAPAEEVKKAPAKTAKTKPGKKPFVMPRLQTGKGFTTMKRPGQQQAPEEAAGGGDEEVDMQEMLKKIPGGANNPDVQKYLNKK